MSSPKMQEKLNLEKELCDPPPLNNISLPTASQLLDACTTVEARGHTTWPLEGPPVFWIKYGRAVYWNEVLAQNMAHRELWSLESPVRAPAVFYAFKYQSRVFLVMGHIAGDTASKRLEEAGSQEETDRIVDLVALSLSELYRIPIAPGSRPAAVDGGRIRHTFFEDQDAPMHYGNVSQLEEHIDKFLNKLHEKRLARKKGALSTVPPRARVTGLSREPMVFCQSDLYPENFLIDDTGHVVVIDFSEASIVPSSFASYCLHYNRLEFGVRDKVRVPTTDGVDNTQALLEASNAMTTGWVVFESLGRNLKAEWHNSRSDARGGQDEVDMAERTNV